MDQQLFFQIVINGLMIGFVYIIMALGFTLIFGIMRVPNFAHGEFYMIGAYVMYVLCTRNDWPYIAALPVAMFVAGALGVAIERTLFKPFIGREFNGFIIAIAISLCLQALALIIFGPTEVAVSRPVVGALHIGMVTIPRDRLLVGACALAAMGVLYVFLHRTRTGLALRAVAEDERIAALQGMRPSLIHPLAFGIGCLLAGLAGALMAPIYTVGPHMGDTPMMKAFVVVILGGLGSIPGAVLGGLLFGLAELALTTLTEITISAMLVFAAVVVVISVRPAGLLGRGTA